MNRIDEVFVQIKQKGGTAFIPFLTIGDPDIATSVEIIRQLEVNGADIVELGVPYSDPLADGPVIQRASQRALVHKLTILDCMKAASQAREAGVRMPFILFSYYNPILQIGVERSFAMMAENGISGAIIPDLPFEEDEEARAAALQHGIHLIPLVAPTSNERIRMIASRAQGFVYCVSSLGVTGVRAQFHEGIELFLDSVREATEVPIAVGFGVSTNEHFRTFAKHCDGVIVGSALVRKIEELIPRLSDSSTRPQALEEIGRFAGELRA